MKAVFDQFHDTLWLALLKKNNTIQQKKFKRVSIYDRSSPVTKFGLFYLVDLEAPLDQWGEGFYSCAPSLLSAVPSYPRSGRREIPSTRRTGTTRVCTCACFIITRRLLQKEDVSEEAPSTASSSPSQGPPWELFWWLCPASQQLSPAHTIDVFFFVLYSKGDQFKY